ncbi:(R,R)-butanediol dehydrogenase [Psilocybe cubensis]|uniref:(R,R)-butanediol dehydrogenase n=1 Tax=Psilocybe cubensis TaxID=181762 RepID=A0ACB8GFM4_PSICU|nr:(R,R)-butanediol dehydrogenase [Psilocybe cubensis]KAH9474414.1 (R,R)-butanediol dehydrogenase [Psilocybe cubensis]
MKAALFYGPGQVRVEHIPEPQPKEGQVKVKGIGGWGGGLAEYIAVDTRNLHILPDGISLEIGAMIEPLAVAWYAVKRSGFKAGQSALITGGGPIGLLVLKVLRSRDPSAVVILSEPASGRRNLALKHGATSAVDPTAKRSPSSDILHDTVAELTNGRGVDVAFDAAGIQASIDACLLNLRPRGTLVNVAIWENNPTININLITGREIVMTSISAYTGIHPELLEAVAAGEIKDLEDLITKKIHIDDVVEEGIKALLNEKDKQVKILVHP